MASIDLQPLTGVVGAEITGVDLSDDLSDGVIDSIHQAFLDHHVRRITVKGDRPR